MKTSDSVSNTLLLDSRDNRAVVDCFRGLGILLVVCFHVVIGLASILDGAKLSAYLAAMPPAINVMWQAIGSELVFLFSGFLLAYLVLREVGASGRVDIRDYLLRRFSRIVPLYVLAIGVYAGFQEFSGWDLMLNLAFVSKVFDAETIVPVGWSLEVLVQFYIVLPWFALLVLRVGRPYLVCTIGIGLSLAARYYALHNDPMSYQLLPYQLIEGNKPTATQDELYYLIWYRATPLLLGYMLAVAVIDADAPLRRFFASPLWSRIVLLGSFFLIAVSCCLPIHDRHSWLYAIASDEFWLWFWTSRRFVFSIGVCGLTLWLFYANLRRVTPLKSIVRWRVWRHLSNNIYGIYLFHPVFLIPAAAIGLRATKIENVESINVFEVLLIIGLTTTAAVMLSSLLLRIIERPAQQRIREWVRSHSDSGAFETRDGSVH